MINRKGLMVLMVFLAVVSIMIIKSNMKVDIVSKLENFATLEEELIDLEKTEGIKLIIYSTETDCCPDLEKFYTNYNYKSQELTKTYDNKIKTLLVLKDYLDGLDIETAKNIEKNYHINIIPTIIVLDNENVEIKRFIGDYSVNELKAVLDEAVMGK